MLDMKTATLTAVGAIAVIVTLAAVAALLYFVPAFTERYQTLFAAVLAFVGGGAAIFAAWVGAQALAEQTAASASQQRRLEESRYNRESRSIAVSLAGEL